MERSVVGSVGFSLESARSLENAKCWLLYSRSNSSIIARKAPPCLISLIARRSFSFVDCRVRVPGLFSLVLPLYSVSICPLDLLESASGAIWSLEFLLLLGSGPFPSAARPLRDFSFFSTSSAAFSSLLQFQLEYQFPAKINTRNR